MKTLNTITSSAKQTIRKINRNVTPTARRMTQYVGIFITVFVTIFLIFGSLLPAFSRARIIKERVTAEIQSALEQATCKKIKKRKKSPMEFDETEDEIEHFDVMIHQTEDMKTKADTSEPRPGTSKQEPDIPTKEEVDASLFSPPKVHTWPFEIAEPGRFRRFWNDLKYRTGEARINMVEYLKGLYSRILNLRNKDKDGETPTDWNTIPCTRENKDLYATSRSAYNHFSALWQNEKYVPCELIPSWFLNPIWFAHQGSIPFESRMSLKACVANPALLDTLPNCKKHFEEYMSATEDDYSSYTAIFEKIRAAIPSQAVDRAFEYFPLLCILFQTFRHDLPLSFSMAIVELLKKWVPKERKNMAVTIGGLVTYLIFKTVGCTKKDRQLRAKVSIEDIKQLNTDSVKTVLSVVMVLFMGLILWKIPTKRDFDSIFNRFGRAGPNIRGITELTNWANQNSGAFVDWFGVRYLNKEQTDPLKILRAKLKEYDHPDFIKRMNADTNLTTEVFLTYLDWIDYIDSLTPKSRRELEPYTRRIVEFKKKAQSSPAAGVHFKAEPPVVLLSGNPGVGKTSCIPYICASHLAHIGVLSRENFKNDGSDIIGPWVYYAKTSDKHWTGYNSLKTKITIFDDANQAVPEAVDGIPLPILLIHYANSAPTHIPQASLEDKENNSYFNGGLIILSDNVEKPDTKKVLLCDEAYTRRLDIVAEVVVNESYPSITKKIGSKEWKVPAFECPNKHKTDAWSFKLKNPATGEEIDTVSFEEFLKRVNDLYDVKRSHFVNNNKDLARFVDGLLPKSAVEVVSVLGWVAMSTLRNWFSSPLSYAITTILGFLYWPAGLVALSLKLAFWVTAPSTYTPGANKNSDLLRLSAFLFSIPVIYILWSKFWQPGYKVQKEIIKRGKVSYYNSKNLEMVANVAPGVLAENAKLEEKLDRFWESCNNGVDGYEATERLVLTPSEEELLNIWIEHEIEEHRFSTGQIGYVPYLWKRLEEREPTLPLSSGRVKEVAEELVVNITRQVPVEWEDKNRAELTNAVEEVLLQQGRVKAKSYQAKNTYSAARESRQKLTKSLQTKVYAGVDSKLIIEKNVSLAPGEGFVSKTLRVPDVEPDLERYLERYDKFAFDQNLRDFLTHKVAKATYAIRLLGGKKLPTLNCVFVKGNLAVAPRHFFYGLEQYSTMELVQADGRNKAHIKVPLSEVKVFPIGENGTSKDTCYFYVPPRFIRRHADLTKSFYTRDQICQKYKNRFFIYGYKMTQDDLSIHMACTTGAYHNEIVGLDEAIGVNCLVLNVYVQDGICGSILGSMTANRTHQLFGIVNGGDVSSTVCNVITQEEIGMVSQHLQDIGIDNGTAEDIYESSLSPFCKPYVENELFNFANMRNTASLICKAFISPDTRFIQSPLFELFGKSTTKPVNIGGRTPIMEKKCFSKYDTEQVVVGTKDLAVFRMGVMKRLAGATPYVTDLDKAIRGDCETGIQPMNRKTSPGFPWLEFGRNAGKKEWLGENEDWHVHEDLAAAVAVSEEKARRGVTEFVVWMDQYKDERLPIQKVDNGKIRLFAIGPLHFNVLCRKYLIWAMEHLVLHKIENGSLVGIDPEAHFRSLYGKIQEINDPHSACMIAGDYSNFDGSLARPFLHEIGEVLAGMMEDGDAVALRSIWEALISSNHVFRGHVYGLSQSQPSGNIFTTHLNTLYNLAIIEMVIKKVAWKNGFDPEEHDFRVFAYGDDNIVVFSKRFIEFVPESCLQAIPSMMAEYGHTYTTDSKDSQYFEYRPITDITILKRNFLVEDRHVFAPLCLSTVLERNYWMAKTKDENVINEQMEMNLYTTYLDLSQHSLPVFKEFSRAVRKNYIDFGGDKMEIGLAHDQLRGLSIENADRAEMERQFRLKAFSTLHPKGMDDEIDNFDLLGMLTETELWMGTHDDLIYFPADDGFENVVMAFQTEKANFRINVMHSGYPCDRKEVLIMFFIECVMRKKHNYPLNLFPIPGDWTAFRTEMRTPTSCSCEKCGGQPRMCEVDGFLCVGPKSDMRHSVFKLEPKKPLTHRIYEDAVDKTGHMHPDTTTYYGFDYNIHKADRLKPKSDNTIPEVQKILEIQDVEEPDMQTLEGATPTPQLDREMGEESKKLYTVNDITERKWLLATVLVNSGSAPGSILYTAHFPNVLFENEQIMRMVSNFVHFRADFEIEIVATVNPQVAWAVRCFIAPDLDPNFLRNRTGTLLQQSQFVNSIIKGPSQPRMKIVLPWVSQFSHRNMSTSAGNAGTFYIAPITQADGPVNLAVYVTMKNVELQYPTELKMVYLSSTHKKHAYQTLGYKVISGENLKPKGLLSLLAGEAKNILSAGLAAGINTGIESVGKIPVIGPLASSALTRYASPNCRPLSDEPSHRVAIRPVPDNVNVQGLEIGTNFGLDTLNSVEHEVGVGGTGVDEMSFERFYTHPNYISAFSVSSSQASGTRLLRIPIWPFNGRSVSTESARPQITLSVNTQRNGEVWFQFVGASNIVVGSENVATQMSVFRAIYDTSGNLWAPINTNISVTVNETAWALTSSIGSISGPKPPVGEATTRVFRGATEETQQERITFQEYVASPFRYWNGRMKFDIYLALTAFHSVKLRFVEVYGLTDATLNAANVGAFPSTVHEFGVSDFVQITTAAPSNFNFKVNPIAYNAEFSPTVENSIGFLDIMVEVPLEHPSSVASTVSGWVEQSFVDMLVGVPLAPELVPILGDLSLPAADPTFFTLGTMVKNTDESIKKLVTVYRTEYPNSKTGDAFTFPESLQSKLDAKTVETLGLKTKSDVKSLRPEGAKLKEDRFGGGTEDQPLQAALPRDICFSTFGESITSFAELGKIFCGSFGVEPRASPTIVIINSLNYAQTGLGHEPFMTQLDYIQCAYGFFKGSMAFRMVPTSGNLRVKWHSQIPISGGPRLAFRNAPVNYLNSLRGIPDRNIIFFGNLEGGCQFRVPSYNPFSILRNSPTAIVSGPTQPVSGCVSTTLPGGVGLAVYIAMGDDRRCYQVVGLPPFKRIVRANYGIYPTETP